MQHLPTLSGILLIDKPKAMTSHDVVAIVRRLFRPDKIKVGHAGTLDPDATGLLLICIGLATRLADLLVERGKTYWAEFELGRATTSEDSSGNFISEVDASHISQVQVVESLFQLTGSIKQVPPMVSAVHHKGQRLHELARKGVTVEREARVVEVYNIELLEFQPGQRPTGVVLVECGKGTYIRTLCADLGQMLGVGGHMRGLRRLRIGSFDVRDAVPIRELTKESLLSKIIPAANAISFLPSYRLGIGEKEDVLHGRAIPILNSSTTDLISLLDTDGNLIALAKIEAGFAHPKKVLTGQ